MFCFLTLAVICSSRVCVCESAVWERVRVVVCRLCLALFITQPNDEFIFLCFVFFSHARHVQLVILCAYHRMSYFACLPQRRRRRRRWRQPALACLLSLPVLFVFLSPLLAGQQKSKMMCYGVTWHVSYMLLLRRVVGLGGFCFLFSTCNVLQAKKKWVLAAVQNCDTKGIRLTIEILHIFYFGIAKEASSF